MKQKIITIGIISLLAVFSIYGNVFAMVKNSSELNTRQINFMDKDVELKLDTKNIASKLDDISVYTDLENNEYVFKDGVMVGFLKERDLSKIKSTKTSHSYASEEKKEINKLNVDNFVKSIINEDITSFDEYKFEGVKYIYDYDEIDYTYTKYIDGIRTNDSIVVSLDSEGQVVSYIANRQGIFNNLKLLEEEEKIDKYILHQVESNYRNATSYKIENKLIDFIDGRYVISYDVELKIDNYIDLITIDFEL